VPFKVYMMDRIFKKFRKLLRKKSHLPKRITKLDALLTADEQCRHFYASAQSAFVSDKCMMLSTSSSSSIPQVEAKTLSELSL